MSGARSSDGEKTKVRRCTASQPFGCQPARGPHAFMCCALLGYGFVTEDDGDGAQPRLAALLG
eukprot:2196559-Pleurochrysis_carterae.AAC.1